MVEKLSDKYKNYFKDLCFIEESHKYLLYGEILPSVSHKIKKFEPQKDWVQIAKNKSLSTGINYKTYLKEWEEKSHVAAKNGTNLHSFAERPDERKPITPQEKSVLKFFEDYKDEYVILAKELRMYHEKYMFAGTTDLVLLHVPTSKVVIGDHKSNKDMYKQYRDEKMLYPFDNLPNNPLSHHKIQMTMYKMMLSQVENSIADKSMIIWFKQDGEYEVIHVEQYEETLIKYFDDKR
jgi:hypothetical protein